MNLVRVGRVVRTLRRRRGWRQVDLARAAVCSQQMISLVECGWADRVSLRTTMRLLAAMEAELDLVIRWRGGQLESLLDEGHASLTTDLARTLERAGWLVRVEVTYAVGREAGSIDVLAFHSSLGILLVVEVKTELLSAEATVRKLDEKRRLAALIARERFDWESRGVSLLLVLPGTSTARNAIARHGQLFERVAPLRGRTLRRWLANPTGGRGGILFLANTKHVGDMRALSSRRRIRRPRAARRELAKD